MIPKEHIFQITNDEELNDAALQVFRYQAQAVPIYRDFVSKLKIAPESVQHYTQIPFLPIRFFKSHTVLAQDRKSETQFISSGTTGQQASKHEVEDLSFYLENTVRIFTSIYGHPKEWHILALLPSYLERSGSSLIAMTKAFIEIGAGGGFFLHNFEDLAQQLREHEKYKQKTLLLGVTFGLLDFAALHPMPLQYTTIMETGGMKGRKEELTRDEVHNTLKKAFKVAHIHSEYGMTELFSQAYAQENGLFVCPPWMKVLSRDTTDPFSWTDLGKTGGINVIDLANQHSCAFIATEDLGKLYPNGSFEILGRFDQSEARGCNLMAL